MRFRWERGHAIGKGQFGTVYSAVNLDTGKKLAVKQLNLHDDQGRRNFQTSKDLDRGLHLMKREIDVVKDLCHPHILRYFGTERNGGSFSIFMEYIPLGSLRG